MTFERDPARVLHRDGRLGRHALRPGWPRPAPTSSARTAATASRSWSRSRASPRAARDGPVAIQPNAGLPETRRGRGRRSPRAPRSWPAARAGAGGGRGAADRRLLRHDAGARPGAARGLRKTLRVLLLRGSDPARISSPAQAASHHEARGRPMSRWIVLPPALCCILALSVPPAVALRPRTEAGRFGGLALESPGGVIAVRALPVGELPTTDPLRAGLGAVRSGERRLVGCDRPALRLADAGDRRWPRLARRERGRPAGRDRGPGPRLPGRAPRPARRLGRPAAARSDRFRSRLRDALAADLPPGGERRAGRRRTLRFPRRAGPARRVRRRALGRRAWAHRAAVHGRGSERAAVRLPRRHP